jgi:histidyl-tRNA synthetase
MIIQPRILKGFRDSLPKQELVKRNLIHILEMNFRSFGFEPIDTPVLEYTEVLLGKGSGETDKQIYRFTDNGNRDISMRFDLTVPFARFMAAHHNELYEPFRRYHIAKVWRGENTQKGRYREFFQCDFDIVGVDTVSADFEILLMMYQSLKQIGIDKFTIKVAHRGIFNDFLEKLGVSDDSEEILRIVDKISKIGREEVINGLSERIGPERAEHVVSFIEPGENDEQTLEKATRLSGGESEHTQRLREIFTMVGDLGLSAYFSYDPSITRGLDYYTGIVYETILEGNQSIGSVCSGGRYNELASLYTKKSLPGVGSSIGLDRLLAALEDSDTIVGESSLTDILIFHLDETYLSHYHSVAQKLRSLGFSVEVYPEKKKLQQQFKFAEKKNIEFGLFIGSEEKAEGKLTMKNLTTRSEFPSITLEEASTIITDQRRSHID